MLLTVRFGATLACWMSLLVVIIYVNAFVILNVDDYGKELGQAITGGTVVILTTIRYALYPIFYDYFPCRRGGGRRNDGQEGEEKESNKKIVNVESNFSNEVRDRAMMQEAHDASTVEPLSTPLPDATTFPARLVFLDHIKIFLTFMVVTFHVSCSFGACKDTWILIVGNTGTPLFDFFNFSFALLNQAYFMPLFFFISAYLLPPLQPLRSHDDQAARLRYDENRRHSFLVKKTKRLYLPAMVTTLFINPATFALSQYVRGDILFYFPWPSHCWYLFWLLLFIWVYHSLIHQHQAVEVRDQQQQRKAPAFVINEDTEQADKNRSEEQQHHINKRHRPFPKTWTRLLYGSFFCGALTLGMIVLSFGALTWGLIPSIIGGFPADCFMFGMGIVSQSNEWLLMKQDEGCASATSHNDSDDDPVDAVTDGDSSKQRQCPPSLQRCPPSRQRDLKSQMDISPPMHRFMVLIEIVAMVAVFTYLVERKDDALIIWQPVLAFLLAGIYCVDMGLLVVQTFQEYVCTEMKWTRWLSKASYTVYLIHPAVIVSMTSLYICGYNRIAPNDDQIVFDGLEGSGGGDFFWLGWILVAVTSHLIVWPLSSFLANLPVLRDVL